LSNKEAERDGRPICIESWAPGRDGRGYLEQTLDEPLTSALEHVRRRRRSRRLSLGHEGFDDLSPSWTPIRLDALQLLRICNAAAHHGLVLNKSPDSRQEDGVQCRGSRRGRGSRGRRHACWTKERPARVSSQEDGDGERKKKRGRKSVEARPAESLAALLLLALRPGRPPLLACRNPSSSLCLSRTTHVTS
jgi:hypothetical protein